MVFSHWFLSLDSKTERDEKETRKVAEAKENRVFGG